MASTAPTRVDLTSAMLEFFQDNTSAREFVTTTDDNGMVQFVPNTILQANGSRLSNVPMDRRLSLLLDVCDNSVSGEETTEDLGLVTALLAANKGGGDAALRNLRKRRTIVGRAFEFLVASTTTSGAPRLGMRRATLGDSTHLLSPSRLQMMEPTASFPIHPPSTTLYTLPLAATPPPSASVLGKHGCESDASSETGDRVDYGGAAHSHLSGLRTNFDIPKQFEAKWTKLVTLAGQVKRSAQIPLPALIAIDREVQTTLDQCEHLASKSSQLEGEREVVADLVIGYDLGIAQSQPKLTADWFLHTMSATHTPAAAASKKRTLQELKDPRTLGGKDSYQSMSAWQQTAPTSRWYSPTHQSSCGGGPAYSPPPHAGRGGGAHTAPPPSPGFQPRHYTPSTRGRGAGRSRGRGGPGGGPSRGRSGGGGGGPMCAICTNAGKPTNHPFTACPLTTCHKCGQPGHI